MKNKKKLITEQSVGKCQNWTSTLLKMMCETGCFPEGITPTTYEGNEMPNFKGQQVGTVPSKNRPGYNAVYFGDYDQTKGGCTVMYYSGDTFDNPLINPATKKPLIKKANCEDMNETLEASYGKDIQTVLNAISAYTKGQVISFYEGQKNPQLISQGWSLIPITQAPGYEKWGGLYDAQLGNRPQRVMVWKKGKYSEYGSNQSEACIKKYTDRGMTKTDKPIGIAGKNYINILDDAACKEYFDGPVYFMVDYSNLTPKKTVNELNALNTKMQGAGTNKEDCRKFISLYYDAYEKKMAITQVTIDNYKSVMRSCKTNHKYIYPWINKSLTDIEYKGRVTTSTGEELDYSLQGGKTVAQESLNVLKQTIKENLIKTIENKKRILTEESKIVKNRLLIITENRGLKTKKQKDKFCSDLLSEMIYFNKQGFNKELINEQLWDMLKGVFGNGAEGVMQTFKEYIGSWLVDNLTPIETDGWLGQLIITSVGNLDFADIPKLTNCDFLTKFLAKNISETMIKKVQTSSEVTGTFYDILRNSIVETMEQSDLGQKLEKGLVEIICPLLSGVKTKMDTAADKLKQGAISAAA